MDIKDWASAKDTAPLYRELKELDLLEHLAELEAFGYTILPPEKVGSVEQLHAIVFGRISYSGDFRFQLLKF